MSNRLDPDYTEDAVAMALQMFLSLVSFPWDIFSIELFSKRDERDHAVDGRLDSDILGFQPFFMQFKKPFGYPASSSRARIIRDRTRLSPSLPINPHVLFFRLLDMKRGQTDFQHNILYRLNEATEGCAAYVCPLLLNRREYFGRLHASGLERWQRFRMRPWDWEDIFIHDFNTPRRFGRVPAFTQHISIPPHKTVTDAKHLYSFTERGTDICFHSPETVPTGPTLLSQWLKSMYTSFRDKRGVIAPQDAGYRLVGLIEKVGLAADKGLPDKFSLEKAGITGWLDFGHFLKRTYGIELYAFIRWA